VNNKKIMGGSLVFIISFALFFSITYFSNTVLTAYDVTSVRISQVLNPVLGIVYGWPAIMGCAFANALSDYLSGYKMFVVILGVFTQTVYGALPYYAWKKIVPSKAHITRLNGPKITIFFTLLMAINSVIIGLTVGGFQFYTTGSGFFEATVFAALNDFDVCMIFGLPLMAIFDFVYSKYLHERKRKITVNEVIILSSALVQLIAFIFIAVVYSYLHIGEGIAKTWKSIFTFSAYTVNIIIAISIVLMSVFKYIKTKKSGLRIFEKESGLIFVDEKRRLEFVSFPSFELSRRVKSDALGYKYEDTLTMAAPTYENAWHTMLSCQKGCPMKCTFCDCPGYGFYGNASVDDLKYQMATILENSGCNHTKWCEVDFSRMGEPTFNTAVLDYIEFDLKKQIEESVSADVIFPSISTILPKVKKDVLDYLLRFCRIKNEIYGGNAALQFSIDSTDEAIRNKQYNNRSLSLAEIAEIGKKLPNPIGRKYALNFAITKDSVIDAKVIDELFEKEKFLIKFTPVHKTFNAVDNGFNVTTEYSDFSVFEGFEKQFLELGWEVYSFLDKEQEDIDGITCGNLSLSNISEKVPTNKRNKKKIGLILAIEIGAVFELYPNWKRLPAPAGYKAYLIEKENYTLYVLQAGMGEVAASAGVQYLISKYRVSMILNFGVVGGLTNEMSKQKVCLVDKIVHYKYDCSEFLNLAVGQVDTHDSIYLKPSETLVKNALFVDGSLKTVTCCSGDKFIGTVKEKTYLHETFGGDICDMESAGIVLTCESNRIPCIMFKAISDGLSDGAAGFFAELESASLKCLKTADRIMEKIANME